MDDIADILHKNNTSLHKTLKTINHDKCLKLLSVEFAAFAYIIPYTYCIPTIFELVGSTLIMFTMNCLNTDRITVDLSFSYTNAELDMLCHKRGGYYNMQYAEI